MNDMWVKPGGAAWWNDGSWYKSSKYDLILASSSLGSKGTPCASKIWILCLGCLGHRLRIRRCQSRILFLRTKSALSCMNISNRTHLGNLLYLRMRAWSNWKRMTSAHEQKQCLNVREVYCFIWRLAIPIWVVMESKGWMTWIDRCPRGK